MILEYGSCDDDDFSFLARARYFAATSGITPLYTPQEHDESQSTGPQTRSSLFPEQLASLPRLACRRQRRPLVRWYASIFDVLFKKEHLMRERFIILKML